MALGVVGGSGGWRGEGRWEGAPQRGRRGTAERRRKRETGPGLGARARAAGDGMPANGGQPWPAASARRRGSGEVQQYPQDGAKADAELDLVRRAAGRRGF